MSHLIKNAVAYANRISLTRRAIEPLVEPSVGPKAAKLQLEANEFRLKIRPLFDSAVAELLTYIDTGSLYATENGLGLVIDQYGREELGNRSLASRFEYTYRNGPDVIVTRTIRGGAGSVHTVEKAGLENAFAKWLIDAILAR